MIIASSIGADVFPVVIGHLMLHILFMFAIFIGGKITQHENKSTIIQRVHSEEMVKFNPSN